MIYFEICRSLTGGDQATLISVPSVSGRESVRVLELSASTMACPRGLCELFKYQNLILFQ